LEVLAFHHSTQCYYLRFYTGNACPSSFNGWPTTADKH